MVTPEKLATALPATNTLANFGRQESEYYQPQDFRAATSSLWSTLQSARFGGGGRASCNAFTFYSAHTKGGLKHLN